MSMKNKRLLVRGGSGVLIAGAAFLFRSGDKELGVGGDSSGLVIGQNAIYVTEQTPGRSVTVSIVRLEKPGFVVIYQDAGGTPGAVLGVSNLLPAGETEDAAPIILSRTTADGEVLHAMLHLDDGDGQFDAVVDQPARDPVGEGPVAMEVIVSTDAAEPGVVNP